MTVDSFELTSRFRFSFFFPVPNRLQKFFFVWMKLCLYTAGDLFSCCPYVSISLKKNIRRRSPKIHVHSFQLFSHSWNYLFAWVSCNLCSIPASQKEILDGSSSILSTIWLIRLLWDSPICPNLACNILFLSFFKPLTTTSQAENAFTSQVMLFISHTRLILDPVITIFPPQCKYIVAHLVLISTPCSLSWLRENRFALASGTYKI